MKSRFKDALFQADFASFINKLIGLVVKDDVGQRQDRRTSGLYQSLIFVFLNLVRDSNFDQLPSYTLAKWEECKKLDISYYELKEFERSLG